MSNAVQAQHPAVVLRSRYEHLRALLAIAAITIVGLTFAVVALATGDGHVMSPPTRVPPAISASGPGARLDYRALKERPNATHDHPGHH
jgi:hypothetical protein